MAALIPLLVQGGLAVGGSLLSNKLSKAKPTPTEANVLGQDATAQQLGLNTAQNLTATGTPAVTQPINYWASILSNNRGAATSALAPEISRISQGYQTATNTSAALNPRGGPGAEFNAELPFAQQRDITTLLQGARPDAAKNLASTGTNILNSATQSLYGSTAAGRDILNQQQNQKELEAARGKAIGAGLFDLINKYGPGISDKVVSILSRGGGNTATGGVLGQYP